MGIAGILLPIAHLISAGFSGSALKESIMNFSEFTVYLSIQVDSLTGVRNPIMIWLTGSVHCVGPWESAFIFPIPV